MGGSVWVEGASLRDGIADFGAIMIDTQSVVWMLSS